MDWSNVVGYDEETYPNCFAVGFVEMTTGVRRIFEISDRVNQSLDLYRYVLELNRTGARLLGFNNENFDYPVLHFICQVIAERGHIAAGEVYNKAMQIINSDRNDWSHNIWEKDRFVRQIDLFKIMHFDNVSKATSLKKLEMAMRSWSVIDLPFPVGSILTNDQKDVLIQYMMHDINETMKFALEIADQIAFRDELTIKYNRDFTNFNDTKIGKQHFIDELEKSGIECYQRIDGKRRPKQTPRDDGIHVGRCLIPIPFQTPDLQRMWSFFNAAVIPAWKTKGFFTDLSASLGDFEMIFGAGGIHGSVNKKSYFKSDTHSILDVDVTSYYPSLAIVNRWFPEHLGSMFCDIYADLKKQRTGYEKGTPENAMLKLALNGVYGDSNNEYSPFYDPAYTMAITINGQLLLSWLAELIYTNIPGVEIIQINTDGLTVYIPNEKIADLESIKQHWQISTRLDLEQAEYTKMLVRDVNNYVAFDTKGKIKRKNAYLTKPEWHQDHSSLVIQKAVDAFFQHGTKPVDFIYAHDDYFDFMRHVKVPRSSRLMWGTEQVQNTSRYYISLSGQNLTKVMPPLAAGDGRERSMSVDKGWLTKICNVASDFNWLDLNRRFYVNEAQKLIAGVGMTC